MPAVALGEASLTVNEQTQMLATIDDNGVFHQAHIIKSWQLPDEAVQTPVVPTHQVLSAAEDSQVQYAMEATTVDGTAVNAATGLGGRQIIGKTGTTSNEHSGFFIGAIPQYALVVGMFANEQNTANTKDSLALLGGGGFGGFWPATIWNTFAQAEFANLQAESFQSPQFSGQLWNLIGPLPKAKPKKTTPNCTVTVHGKKFSVPGKGCPTTTPTPQPSNSFPGGGRVPDSDRDAHADDLGNRNADVDRLWHSVADHEQYRLQRWRWRALRWRCHRADGERRQGRPGRRRGAGGPAARLAAVDDRVEKAT